MRRKKHCATCTSHTDRSVWLVCNKKAESQRYIKQGIGERERANLVVQLARFFYIFIYVYPGAAHTVMFYVLKHCATCTSHTDISQPSLSSTLVSHRHFPRHQTLLVHPVYYISPQVKKGTTPQVVCNKKGTTPQVVCNKKGTTPQVVCNKKGTTPQVVCNKKGTTPQVVCNKKGTTPQVVCNKKGTTPQVICNKKGTTPQVICNKEAESQRYIKQESVSTMLLLLIQILSTPPEGDNPKGRTRWQGNNFLDEKTSTILKYSLTTDLKRKANGTYLYRVIGGE